MSHSIRLQRCYSQASRHKLREITEWRASDAKKIRYTIDEASNQWKIQPIVDKPIPLAKRMVKLFLPARYPTSVDGGYARFSAFAFGASIAGSAGMVLSTQTLLLAVGVVGSAHSASVMAGALNWVLKDGIGQLGGVLFAYKMGETKRFDASPKQWRMVAALSLDAASLMEIMAPMATSSMVLPIACMANVLKNIGFLTASASRAALHQSLAIDGNLADVTAKAGSQSMAAGLVGTALGVGLSSALGHDASNFVFGFCALSFAHQLGNYQSLRSVALRHFNQQRLALVIDHYLEHDEVLTPRQVALREAFLPWTRPDDTSKWLAIGRGLESLCPNGPNDLDALVSILGGERYLLSSDAHGQVHLIFRQDAAGDDLIQGMLHAVLLRRCGWQSRDSLALTHGRVKRVHGSLMASLRDHGWTVSQEQTSIEPSGSIRLAW